MPYTPIIGTLGYVLSPDGQQVLLIHRNARPDDAHYGKYNGLGGKMDRDEDVASFLLEATAALLSVAETDWPEREGAWMAAASLQRLRWPWAPAPCTWTGWPTPSTGWARAGTPSGRSR